MSGRLSVPGRLAVVATAMCGALASACLDTQPCVSRGTTTETTGSASYSGQVTAGGGTTPLQGAVPVAVAIDDLHVDADACSGNPVEFTVHVGGSCVVWALATDTSGDAEIEAGQTCAVPTAQGDAVLAIDQGLLSTTDATSLTLSGRFASLGDAGDVDGYLQWTFSGD